MYELILIDSSNEWMVLLNSKYILEIDAFTSVYQNEKDFLNTMSERFNKTFNKVVIRSIFQRKAKYIKNIVYSNNQFSNYDFLTMRYAKFLFEDKTRIADSFISNFPRFKNANLDYIQFSDIRNTLVKYMTSYKKRRDSYFQLFNCGYIKQKEIVPTPKDYLKTVIDNIDTELGSDEDIMIEKIRSGEIEPNYYDIEDYLSMKRYKKR